MFQARYVVVMLLVIMVTNWDQKNAWLCVEQGGAERKPRGNVMDWVVYVVLVDEVVVICCLGD